MSSLREVLDKVAIEEISPAEAEKLLQLLAIDEVGCFAKLDGNRGLRKGIPEVVLAEGKTPEDVAEISKQMVTKLWTCNCEPMLQRACGCNQIDL